ncbi:MAG: SUMF1/EgtB/PvdO family nonheme iron enzyme [Ignavibacteriales bacterium]|nr:SUMF1/EgtB/PvdO family nonheme iron enzyme [Ignavibacteriales bacterium]
MTQGLWKSVMNNNPSQFVGDNRPVEIVGWNDVIEFCNKLSEREGLQKAYLISGSSVTCDFNANGYRLPTEAEWEYAARGGNKSSGLNHSGSNEIDKVAWFWDNSGSATHDVATKQPNELGIYDMSGNVWEWCWDWYGDYTSSSQTDPRGPSTGSLRVFRGGTWSGSAWFCRVAFRFFPDPGHRGSDLGFRIVRTKK